MKKLNQSGLIGIIALIIAVMVIGYLVISRLTATQTAEDVRQTGTDVIDEARGTVDKANEASNRADNIIDDANEIVR